MKNQIKDILIYPLAVFLVVFTFTSCSDVAGPAGDDSGIISENMLDESDYKWGGGIGATSAGKTNGSTDLFYGRDKEVIGKVYFSINSAEQLEVKFHVTNTDYPISETSIWVGKNLDNIQMSASGPKLGHFPYKNDHGSDVYEFTYTINPADHGIQNPYDTWIRIVTHAVVGKNETAFAGCYEMLDAGSRWWNAINWFHGINYDSVEKCNDIEGKRTGGNP